MIAWNSRPIPALPGQTAGIGLYDTKQQQLVNLPPEPGQGLYVCGITPYDATHMGHAATYVAFDLLNRLWRDSGAVVNYVQNVTDIDDPLLERATATGVDWMDLAIEQTDLFREDMYELNVIPPEHYIGAVESIGWIVPVIESLLERGIAYPVAGDGAEPDGDIYFSVDAATASLSGPEAWFLGAVSHLGEDEMTGLFAERGGDPERPGKRHPMDPLLWRVARSGEPDWDGNTLGRGRPGWHIECAVIAQRFLNLPFTVQAGGSDLVFPHHEMSAAHAEAATGTPLARHFAHAGMVGLDGEKMSKSRGNLVLVSTLRRDGVDPAAIRLAILNHHYRSDWSWTDKVIPRAQDQLASWRLALGSATTESAAGLTQELRSALANDLDAPAAVAAVDRWAAVAPATAGTAAGADAVVDALDALLGIRLTR
ncbi:L-cysteine:1D-myo-inositol 2-amino-2-deoxy-alpha-D-glucopyranoside ligase [Arthrobacter sp. CAN_A212]|uniref:cysteine--1-D-myo-inosityl 2-amino-2-deoxy-alpha-D-glucopyranoside ligase n=1 Tax=unclassified Arthrobacter TaxID=235627 RepID=UPI0018CA96CC|nr:cysteine--1-D-myo-inosityl 2-amino-2-deoxy-alpha-D-glucopyranoside ligase [Arthrobacter sp. CAN_C5]MBP2216664.1 L-cysteine:1D-myo-inositol 2-amino-2-deoxy-alpha-D-glucopyranoside ligase [Arthrobacter sp. CAN_C5]